MPSFLSAPEPSRVVRFPCEDGHVAANLYLPKESHGKDAKVAVVVGGSLTSIKEQMGGTYASELPSAASQPCHWTTGTMEKVAARYASWRIQRARRTTFSPPWTGLSSSGVFRSNTSPWWAYAHQAALYSTLPRVIAGSQRWAASPVIWRSRELRPRFMTGRRESNGGALRRVRRARTTREPESTA